MMSNTISSTASIALHTNDTHHHMDGWSMMGGWWFWIIVLIVIFVLIAVLIYLVIKEERNKGIKSESYKSARKLLDERYAKGEISTDEYREMKKEMKK